MRAMQRGKVLECHFASLSFFIVHGQCACGNRDDDEQDHASVRKNDAHVYLPVCVLRAKDARVGRASVSICGAAKSIRSSRAHGRWRRGIYFVRWQTFRRKRCGHAHSRVRTNAIHSVTHRRNRKRRGSVAALGAHASSEAHFVFGICASVGISHAARHGRGGGCSIHLV